MQINFAIQALDHLGKTHFNKTWPKDSIQIISADIEQLSDKAMVEAVKRARIEISPSTFPALKRILDILKEEQIKINLSTSPMEPGTRRENDKEFISSFGNRSDEHAKRAMDLCMRIADGNMAVDKVIAYCGRMEKEYPNVGWRETELFYIKQNNGLDSKTLSGGV